MSKKLFIKIEDNWHELIEGFHYELQKVENIDQTVLELKRKKKEYEVTSAGSLKTTNPQTAGIVKLLLILKETNCGCCNSPFLSKEAFDKIIEFARNYNNEQTSHIQNG